MRASTIMADGTQQTLLPINLALRYPGIYFHLKDQRAADHAHQSVKTAKEQEALFERHRKEAEESHKRLLPVIKRYDAHASLTPESALFRFALEKRLVDGFDFGLQTLLLAKEHYRYFRGIGVLGTELTVIEGCDLSNIDFGNAIFECAVVFRNCLLQNANFQGAIFKKKLVICGANVTGANFHDAMIASLEMSVTTQSKGKLLTNEHTRITLETMHLNDDIALTLSGNNVYVNDHLYPVELLWDHFVAAYRRLPQARGDKVAQTEKLLPIERIRALLEHARSDNKSRTLKALIAVASAKIACSVEEGISETTFVSLGHFDEPQHTAECQLRVIESSKPVAFVAQADADTLFIDRVKTENVAREVTQEMQAESWRKIEIAFQCEHIKLQAEMSEKRLKEGLLSLDAFSKTTTVLWDDYQALLILKRDTGFVDEQLTHQIFFLP